MKKTVLPIFLVMLTLLSCSTTEPIPVNENIKITEIDAAVIEVYLKIQIENPSPNKEVIIERDGQRVISFAASKTDTAITDTGLTENTIYKYKAKLTEKGKVIGESSEVSVTTMLPTSHNFTWETFTFGEHGSSVFYDVAIVNDTLTYAVGTIYLNDRTGNPDPQPYCLAKWNGKTWSPKKLYYKDKDYQGNEFTSVLSNIRGIFAFSSSDIWLAAGSVFRWDGTDSLTEFSYHILTPSGLLPGINKLWGTSSSNLYGVGNSGSIVHYSNSSWQKIESGTNVRLLDVNGTADGKTVWINGYEDFKPTVLLKYNNNSLTTIINDQNHLFNDYPGIISGGIESIWINSNNRLFLLTWYGLYRVVNNNFNNPQNLWSGDPNTWALIKARGNDVNDIIASGINGRIWHYNGVSWKFYSELANQSDTYYSTALKGSTCITVGYRYVDGVVRYGLVQVGHR